MSSTDSFDLSLSDHSAIMNQPFSLLTRVDPDVSTPTHSKASTSELRDQNYEEGVESTVHDVEIDGKRQAARLREEKLQSDIFILKKLNAAFESFNGALQDTGSANERVAAQVEQTDALLNKYIDILSKSEEFARLIFDDQWEGAQADEEFLERERTEAIERARKEAEEEEARRKWEEQAKFEQERQERLKREEKERLEREKSERAIRGGVRGVRGTRASTLGRGAALSGADGPSARGISKRPQSVSSRIGSSAIPRPPRPS